jgi:NADH:ubiquinone oxidoreductase subunit 5 (subunit L)/multisubunit Na+/H+ antiporter MnhA subunit
MRDVETQLREYFDAAVERVTVDDVLARRRVGEQAEPHRRRWVLRPAWAAVLAFAGTLVVLGGSLALGVAVREPGVDAGWTLIPETVGEATTTTSNWWVLIPAIALTIAVVAALIVRNQQVRARKETAMATTIETPPAEQLKTAERHNRWLIVTVVVLAVALVALGAWVMYDLASEPETAANAEINAVFDDYAAAWQESDREAFLALTTDDYTFNSSGRTTERDVQAAAISTSSSFAVKPVGDLVVMGDGPEYFVAVANQISYQGSDYVGISVYRIVETEDGLKVSEHTFVGNL